MGDKGCICRSENEFRLEGVGLGEDGNERWEGRWLETKGEEGGIMRTSENASLDMESLQNVHQLPPPPSRIR